MNKIKKVFVYVFLVSGILFYSSLNLLAEKISSNKFDTSIINENKVYEIPKVGECFGVFLYYNNKLFFNKLKENFEIGTSSSIISADVLKKIMPGIWLMDVTCNLYINNKLEYAFIDFEKNQNGTVSDVGIIEPVDNGLIFRSKSGVNLSCKISDGYFSKTKNKTQNEYFFNINFSKTYFHFYYQLDCIQARMLFP